MVARTTAIQTVKSFAAELLKSGLPLDSVILFGSFAHGEPHEWSDIDVALVSESFSGFGFEDSKLFSRIHLKKEYEAIEVKTFPTSYFRKGDPFIEEIKRTGIPLFDSAALQN